VAAAAANLWIRWEFQGVAPVLDQGWYLQIIFLPIIQFFVAATAEEPFFRGLLWGYLKRQGRPDGGILVVQALLFFVCHAYYARPGLYANWGSTLFTGVVFGIAAWKTRSILPSMIAHALVNGLTQAFTSSLK
jgi:membrane protease YdiL (CAAX protease family)